MKTGVAKPRVLASSATLLTDATQDPKTAELPCKPIQKEAAMRTRPISKLVFLGVLAACESTNEPAAPSGPSLSAAGLIRENFKFELELTFDCTAAGGEIIDVSGTVHQTLTVVLKDDVIHVTSATAG